MTTSVIRVAAALALSATLASPQMAFSDQTAAAGVSAFHRIQSVANHDYPGGGTVGDFDGDGLQDIFWLSGGGWSGTGPLPDKLFINNGDGTFTDQAAAWGVAVAHKGIGACSFDYDDDGDLDVFVVSRGPWNLQQAGHHRLYRNNGNSTFTEVAVAAGVNATVPSGTADGWSAMPNDFDLDGDLDLFVSGNAGSNAGNRMFRNDGDGTFTDVTQTIGFNNGPLFTGVAFSVWGFTPRFVDTDGDFHPELLFTGDFGTSVFFRNLGDATYLNWSAPSNTTHEENGMGSCIGDFDRDGNVDWYSTSIYNGFSYTGNKLYLGNGDLTFDEVSVAAGVDDGGYSWGALAVDFDHDGWLDITDTNNGVQYSPTDFTYLRRNNGDGTFTEMATSSGLTHTTNGRAMVSLDYDDDGDVDVLIFPNNAPFKLFRNDLAAGPDTHWLRVWLDTRDNRGLAPHGIGARISIDIGGVKQYRWIEQATNLMSTSELSAHFGVGSATLIDTLRVEWPDGSVTELDDVAADQTLTVSAPADSAWSDQGGALTGVAGNPHQYGEGTLASGTLNSVTLASAAPSAFSGLFAALSSSPVPFKGGTLQAFPYFRLLFLNTNASGGRTLPFVMPAGVPAGSELWIQWATQDAAAVSGVSLSNALKGVTP